MGLRPNCFLNRIAKTTQLSRKPGNCKCSIGQIRGVTGCWRWHIILESTDWSQQQFVTEPSQEDLAWKQQLNIHKVTTRASAFGPTVTTTLTNAFLNLKKHHKAVTGLTFLKRIKKRRCSPHCGADRYIRCWIWSSDFYFVAWKILSSLQTPFPPDGHATQTAGSLTVFWTLIYLQCFI